MEEWLTCQGKWLYLEPIFSADEIMKQIPREGSAFRMMDGAWRRIAQQVTPQPKVQTAYPACTVLQFVSVSWQAFADDACDFVPMHICRCMSSR